jgi:hypothetical protein
MTALLNAIKIAKTHWKLLLIIFGLGGTGAVAGVLGINPLQEFTDGKIVEVSAPIAISPTVVE